jgi:hypothetical protein
MVIVIISGITLAFHYTNNTALAFASIEHITRDVNLGWLIRFTHQNTVAFFFICVYIHIGRGLFYGSYKAPRALLWIVGVVIFIVMMAEYWPSWYGYSISEWGFYGFHDQVYGFASLPFISPRTHAIKRVGPHNHDVLSRIVFGMLGDWWADRIPSKGRFSYRFQIDQEDKHKAYIDELTSWFYDRGYCSSKSPKKINRRVTRSSHQGAKVRTIYRLTLFTHTSLGWLYNEFNPRSTNGKALKVIPRWIGSYLTPQALADLIMQDGSRARGQGISIATNCFSKSDCIFLAN